MKCSPCIEPLEDKQKSQPFPTTGVLKNNSNLELKNLLDELHTEHGAVYLYIVDTVERNGEQFVQTGSAPNFQGDLITLCTCKHWMRTFMDADDWKGKWIAGFCNLKAGGNGNALVYLMKVKDAFESHRDLWYSSDITEKTRHAKSAHTNRFGDMFRPRNKQIDPFNHRSYEPPIQDPVHVHMKSNKWHEDICYVGCSRRHPALLEGDPILSYMWNKPLFYFSSKLHRGQKRLQLQQFLSQLKDGN